MSSRLPADVLLRRPEEGARLVLGLHVEEVRRAARRLVRSSDDDALHDLRVATRKLRCALHAYAEVLPARLVRKARRRLAALMSASSEARDTEVALTALGGAPSRAEVEAVSWVAPRWKRARDRLRRRFRRRVKCELPRALAPLRRALPTYTADVGKAPVPLFSSLVETRVRVAAAELRRVVDEADEDRSAETVHRARLAGKRLRYLIEPFLTDGARSGELVAGLVKLQDGIGELRDRAQLKQRLRRAAARAPRSVREGLLRLALDGGPCG